jgi:arylsulfatase A-like enzyme
MDSKRLITRRDFLKLASLASLSYMVAPLMQPARENLEEGLPNIIILVFDAWSAENVSLYGYPRLTMPNLDAFAGHANVYHNHYSAAGYTTPGTASLLTGLYPWTHRAFSLGSGVIKAHKHKNLFALLAEKYSTLGYSQNKYADLFLSQFNANLDTHIPRGAFNYENRDFYTSLFSNDGQIAFSSFDDNILKDKYGYDASLFLGPLLRTLHLYRRQEIRETYRLGYPYGFPETNGREYFSLRNVVDGAIGILRNLQTPTFAYLHFYPPHDPYRGTKKFKNSFQGKDAWEPAEKPGHPLVSGEANYDNVLNLRHRYDDYLASWDDQIAEMFAFMQESDLLDNSYIIITADHGEMFERGVVGHLTPLIFEPLIHIPLVISCPGQVEREDIYDYTSAVDILPTLALLAGLPIPDWIEGAPLPKLGGDGGEKRGIYSIDAKNNSSFKQISSGSISMTKEPYRLTYYNYPESQQFEFYDLDADPEELNDLYPSQPVEAMQMKDEMLQKLAEADRPFKGK